MQLFEMKGEGMDITRQGGERNITTEEMKKKGDL